MTDQPGSGDMPEPSGEPPATEPAPIAPIAPIVAAAAAASTPPPVPPPAPMAPPPAVAWQAAPPPVVVKGGRTPLAMIAGILLILLAIGGGLIGIGIAIFGATIVSQLDLSQFNNLSGVNDPAAVVTGAFAFIGILMVIYSLVYLIGGIGVLRSRGWGRVIGIIVGILSGLFWLASLSSGDNGSGGGVIVLALAVIHIYVVVVLLFLWRSKATA